MSGTIPSPCGPKSKHIKPANLRLYPLCPREQMLQDIREESLDQGRLLFVSFRLLFLSIYLVSLLDCELEGRTFRCLSNPLHPYNPAVTEESFATDEL